MMSVMRSARRAPAVIFGVLLFALMPASSLALRATVCPHRSLPRPVLSRAALARRSVPAPGSAVRLSDAAVPAQGGGVEGLYSPPPDASSLALVEPPFKGLLRDVRAKSKFLVSDVTDGMSLKVVAATAFLFFACIAPAVAFGGLLDGATGGAMGTMEMIGATSVCGMFYALTAGQPLTIIGATGPCLAFTAVLYKTTQAMALPFLPVYAWVGLWCSAILAACSLFSLSNFVEYISRFTDEIFSLLISAIFVLEAVKDISGQLLLGTAKSVPLVQGLLSLSLAATTFSTATTLAACRKGRLFAKRVRETVADFAPTIGIGLGVWAARWVGGAHGVLGRTLNVPLEFATTSGRPWLVPLWEVPLSVRLLCGLPALMATILLFFDQVITVRLVNNAQWKLKKGYGFHLDMAALAVITAFCSVLGLPWLVAATVRSINHVKALASYEPAAEGASDGGDGLVISGVTEQRVSAFAIHLAIGLSIVFCRPLLRQVPMAVLTGLFLYLGQSALKGNEMWERTLSLLAGSDRRPDLPCTRGVPQRKVALFTALQLACLGAMVYIKDSKVGVLFPVLVAGLAPVRILIERLGWFSKAELAKLDSE